MKMHDLIIIGAGPAGLSAAIYAARYKLDAVVISRDAGGTALTAHKVCNFPTYNDISGRELMDKMLKHSENLGITIGYDNVTKIEKKKEHFEVHTDGEKEYHAKTVLFAAGGENRKLNVPGEEKFLGRGVSYCATCDASFYKGKTVAVMGGGNAALTSALMLTDYAKKVYIIYRGGSFLKAEPAWVDAVDKSKKIEIMLNEDISEIKGEKAVDCAKLKSGKELKLDGVFIEIGSVPNTGLLDNLKVALSEGFIKTDNAQKTNVEGFYAAGDITTNSNRFQQIITACAEGAVAVNAIYKELKGASDSKKDY